MTAISTQYELLVAELHQALINADGFSAVSVSHNKTIIGKSGASHQIDVYWEFSLGGAHYKTCIECKHFNTKIKKLHIAAFAAIIADIGGATGIFATTCGFQKGALLLAKYSNIRLVLINPLIREINIQMKFEITEFTITAFKFDEEQVNTKLKELGLQTFEGQFGDETQLLDAEGIVVTTLGKLIRSHNGKDGDHHINADNYYVNTEIGLLHLNQIRYTAQNKDIDQDQTIVSQDTAKAILEDVISNNACYLHTDSTITKHKA